MPILTSPNITALFYIKVNSLDYITGGIFSQESKIDSKWYSVVFFSEIKFLSLIECNYKIHDKKMLVIILDS